MATCLTQRRQRKRVGVADAPKGTSDACVPSRAQKPPPRTAWEGRKDIGELEKEGTRSETRLPGFQTGIDSVVGLGAELPATIGRTPRDAARLGADVWRTKALGASVGASETREGFSLGGRELRVEIDSGGRFDAVVEPPSQQQRTGQLK